MGKEHATQTADVESASKSAPRPTATTDPDLESQGGKASPRATPTFDDYDYRTQGRVPLTVTANSTREDLGHARRSPPSVESAIANFLERFPFLKDVAEAHKERITEVLGGDVKDFRDFRRVDTALNEDYREMYRSEPGKMPADAARLADFKRIDFHSSEYTRRVEVISQDAIFSTIAVEPPRSALGESDEHTYLRQTWENIRKQPVYLTMDAWSEPALKIYITDGTFSWEVQNSPRPIEMIDLLSIGIIAHEYVQQQIGGPKRTALEGAIQEATSGLIAAKNKGDYQAQVDDDTWFWVVGLSKWRGKGAAFDAVVDQYTTVVYGEMAEKKRAAYQPTYLERIGFLIEAFSKAIGALDPTDALEVQYLRGLNEDERKAQFWKNVQLYYGIADDSRRWKLEFTKEEWKAVKEEAKARAQKDWEAAPDVLPGDKSFNRAAEIISLARQYLDNDDLEAATIYATLALQMEQELANSVDRYNIRVTSGAGAMVETLEHVKLGCHLILTVVAPFGAASLGLEGGQLLVASAAIPAAFTAASSIASGEAVGASVFDATKEFVMGVLIGKLSEMMSARFVVRFGIPKPAADILGNAAASPYGAAGDVLFRKMMNPDAPLPTLEDLEAEMVKGVTIGSLVSMATHAATVMKSAPATEATGGSSPPESGPPEAPPQENRMSGSGKGRTAPDPPTSERVKGMEKYARLNEEWVRELRMQGTGAFDVLPQHAEPDMHTGSTFKRNMRTAAEAYDAYRAAMARTKGVEVGVFRNQVTGEYSVQVGGKGAVGPPRGEIGPFETVLHYHPNEGNVLTYRLPSGTDVELAVEASKNLRGRPVTQFIEYPTPSGQRGRTTFTVDSTGNVEIEFHRTSSGKTETVKFESVEKFKEYWGSRTRAVEIGSDDYNDLLEDIARWEGKREVGEPENRMAGSYRPLNSDPDAVGYDSKLGVKKKTVTPDDLEREQKVRQWVEKRKLETAKSMPPAVQELIWELNEANLGHPDPMALYLARLRGTARDQNFRDFIIPVIKKIMPPDSVFGARDYVALRKRLGVERLPWETKKAGGGPDLFLVRDTQIQPLDLTTKGEHEDQHMARLKGQADALQKQLADEWTVEEPQHFYQGAAKFNEVTAISQIAEVLTRYGGIVPPELATAPK